MTQTNKWSQWQADSMIALVAMSWGSSYLLMKIGLDGIPPCSIIALQLGIAFLAVGLIFILWLRRTKQTFFCMRRFQFRGGSVRALSFAVKQPPHATADRSGGVLKDVLFFRL